jgi:hypothetical protein
MLQINIPTLNSTYVRTLLLLPKFGEIGSVDPGLQLLYSGNRLFENPMLNRNQA